MTTMIRHRSSRDRRSRPTRPKDARRHFVTNVTYEPSRDEPRTTTPETLCEECVMALHRGPAWATQSTNLDAHEAATCDWCGYARPA